MYWSSIMIWEYSQFEKDKTGEICLLSHVTKPSKGDISIELRKRTFLKSFDRPARAGRPARPARAYFAASFMIDSMAVSTSRAVSSRVGSPNMASIVVGFNVSRTTSAPSV